MGSAFRPGSYTPPWPPPLPVHTRPPLAPAASFGRRLAGAIVDWLIYMLAISPVLVIAGATYVDTLRDCGFFDGYRNQRGPFDCQGDARVTVLLNVGMPLVWVGYTALVVRALARRGQTWGKRLVGVRVVSVATGTNPDLWTAFRRQAMAILSGSACGLGYLWMLWDPAGETWHDKVASTRVIKV